MDTYDVAILGAGTAGLSARSEVAKKTDKYVVLDGGTLGTTCARVGCMPSKALIEIATDAHRSRDLYAGGFFHGEHSAVNRARVMEQVRSLRDRFVRGVMQPMEKWRATHFLPEHGRLTGPDTIATESTELRAKTIIIATGSSPIMPHPWREFQDHVIDTNSLFDLETLPESMAVIGLGVIGIEIGQALHRLGVQVIGIGRDTAIGGATDPTVREYIARTLGEDMSLHFGDASLDGVTDAGQLRVRSGDHSWTVDTALIAVGRRHNLAAVGIDRLGVALNAEGVPPFDRTTFQVADLPVFIAGDVNGERPILHEATDEGRIAGYNAVADAPECFARRTPLRVTFSQPNIAGAGASWEELTAAGADFVTGAMTFEGFGRAILRGEEAGLLHVYGERTTGRLLGAEMFAPGGEHLAHLIAWAIACGKTVHEALAMPYYHPVLEEGVRAALRDLAHKVQASHSPLEVLRCQDAPAGMRA